jgi:hypothetical protein
MFCRELLTKINDDTLEVANAEWNFSMLEL